MFTPEELQFLTQVVRERVTRSHEARVARHVLGKLLCIDDYYVALYCAGCQNWHNTVEFSQDHTCRRCGRRICDDCHRTYGDLCDRCDRTPPDPEEAFYEAADVLRDWAMDR